MLNPIYSEETKWYDEGVYNAIMELAEKHDNAIQIFGGALWAYNRINSEDPDFHNFALELATVAYNAKHYGWHEGILGALHRFCRLCLVDPSLVEVYIGVPLRKFYETAC